MIHISPVGNDSWTGTFAEPLADGSDGPLASLAEAQARVREGLANRETTREPIIVSLRGGTYRLTESLHLGPEDAGTAAAQVVWQAYPGERVLLSGGVRVDGFRLLSETGLDAPVPEAYRNRIYVANLREQGVAFPAELVRRNTYAIEQPGPLEVYYGGERLSLARYPNTGWVEVAEVPQDGKEPLHPGHHADKRDGKVPTGRHFGAITYAGNRPETWSKRDDIWVHGYWTWDWADSTQRVAGIDPSRKRLELAPPHHRYGYTIGQRYYYFNVPEELDSPGEWYLDRETGHLYIWPPKEGFPGEGVVSQLTGPMIRIRDSGHLVIRGMKFANGRGPGIWVSDSESVLVEACHFQSLGGRPLTIEGGNACGVRDSEFHGISTGAIHLSGGNRTTLEPAGHFAVNNHIHDFAQVFRTNHPAIWIDGVGQRAAHNLIHNAPHMGLYFRGNDHLIEYNEIHDIAQETGDVGAVYTGRDYTSRGTVVRYNYLHDLHGPGLHGVRGVYLDDFTSGITVYGNIFYRAGRAAFIGGGRDNRIENNLFIECAPSVQVDGRGLSWAVHHFDTSHSNYASTLRDLYDAANVERPPYAERYPELVGLYDGDPRVPAGNRVENNLSFGGIFLDLYDDIDLKLVTVRNNLIADPVALRMSPTSDQDPQFRVYSNGETRTTRILRKNWLAAPEASYYRIENGRPIPTAEAMRLNPAFLPIPVERIGLQPGE